MYNFLYKQCQRVQLEDFYGAYSKNHNSLTNKDLSLTLSLSIQLQSVELDLFKAMSDIKDVRGTLMTRRKKCEKSFNKIWLEAQKMAKQADIELKCPRTTRHQAHRGNIEASTPEEYYRLNAFIPFLDYMLTQLDDRFSSHNQEIFHLSALIPSLCNQFEYDHLKEGIHLYSNFLSGSDVEIEGEFEIWQSKLAKVKKPPSNAV